MFFDLDACWTGPTICFVGFFQGLVKYLLDSYGNCKLWIGSNWTRWDQIGPDWTILDDQIGPDWTILDNQIGPDGTRLDHIGQPDWIR